MSALEDIKARVEAATEGPWVEFHENGTPGVTEAFHCAPATGTFLVNYGADHDQQSRDATFIAHSRTDIPKLLAALEAVEALHRKVPVYVTEAGDCKHGADCESVEFEGLSMCPDDTEGYTCDHCAELNPDEYPEYPCSTIRAITEALA